MDTRIIRNKIERLSAGYQPRVLDLFAGCGGLSLGFHAAGFEIAAAIEFDKDAAASHGKNFHPGSAEHAYPRDITRTTPHDLTLDLGLGSPEESFDVIIGGPPCQAFARVGRSKLREIDEHPEAFKNDPRARLYLHYLQYVETCHPLVVLIENVPDIMNHGGQNVPEEICETLEKKGYSSAYTLLNSAYYGVPQMRERMFLLAYRKELQVPITFPAPSHFINLPAGYDGSRMVALKSLTGPVHSYVSPLAASPDLPPAVTVADAIGDLPQLKAKELIRSNKLRKGARRFTELMSYDSSRSVSPYGRLMKDWPGFEAGEGIYDHVIRYLPRDCDLFSRMKHGDQYPEAYRHALTMFDEKIAKLVKKGVTMPPDSDEYVKLRASVVPPYDPGKFPNKWRKMEPDQPARTLMAHLGKDGYSHIHYDCRQARTISVREAARLQSFPDGFAFCGTMNPAFKQIGNSVPPLMAKALATEIMTTLHKLQRGNHNVG